MNKGRSGEKIKAFREFTELLNEMNYLIRKDGTFHPISKYTHTFDAGSWQVDRIKEILKTKIVKDTHLTCAPVYLDEFVFL